MLTPRGVALLAGSVLAWFAGRLLGIDELLVVAAVFAALVLLAFAVVRLASTTIAVRRTLTATRLQSGSFAEAVVELRNDGRLPTALLLVEDRCPYPLLGRDHSGGRDHTRFVVPGLASGAATEIRYDVHAAARGRYRIGPVGIGVRDPMGLVQRTRTSSVTDELIVYPRIDALPDGLSRGAHRGSGASDARRLFNTGDEFYTMREYVTGDDLRQVHWPSTAHRQRLMVRQHEMPWESQALVLCDTRRVTHTGSGPNSTLERAISVTASVIAHFADRGYRLRLVTDADREHVGGGPTESRATMLDRLAILKASGHTTLTPVLHGLRTSGAEGLLAAVLTPPRGSGPVAADPEARALLQAGRGFSGRIALIVTSAGDTAPERRRAEAYALLLSSAGWRVEVLPPARPLSDAWRSLSAGRPRVMPAQQADADTSGGSTAARPSLKVRR